jgi:hypothetical protein
MRRTANVAYLKSLSSEIAHRLWERSRQVWAGTATARRTVPPWCPIESPAHGVNWKLQWFTSAALATCFIMAARDFVLRAKTGLVCGTCERLPVVCSFRHADPNVEVTEVNISAPEFFFILAHTVYKMWIIQQPNTLELWNKLHFEKEKKAESIYHV